MHAVVIAVPARAEAIREVRTELRDILKTLEPLGPEQVADLLVMVSEAATNGLQHGCDPARDDEQLTVTVGLADGGRVRVEVTDPGTGSAQLPRPGEEDEHGRGLQIIAELSSDFGVVYGKEGARTTWFELVACNALPEPGRETTAPKAPAHGSALEALPGGRGALAPQVRAAHARRAA